MEQNCSFCKIVAGLLPSYPIWEDAMHLAFLTLWPNTEGFTVVIPKAHYGSYFADVDPQVTSGLLKAAGTVAKIIDRSFIDVGRTAMIFEGFGVDHLHAKLFPMHGTKFENWRSITSDYTKTFSTYEGYVSSHNGPQATVEELVRVQQTIRKHV